MAVRVKVKIKREKEEVETIAVVNAGYETDEPEIVLPSRLAEKLGLWPELPAGSRIEEYGTVNGLVRLHWVPKGVEISLGKRRVKCNVTISEFEREVLLNDKLTGRLKIIIEDLGKGLWRLPKQKIRKSEKPEYW